MQLHSEVKMHKF